MSMLPQDVIVWGAAQHVGRVRFRHLSDHVGYVHSALLSDIYMLISIGTLFDNTGLPYNLSAVVSNSPVNPCSLPTVAVLLPQAHGRTRDLVMILSFHSLRHLQSRTMEVGMPWKFTYAD